MSDFWMIRTKPLQNDEYNVCLGEQRIRFKWPLIDNLTGMSIQSIENVINGLPLSAGDKKYKVTQHRRVAHDIAIGDYVLILGETEYCIGMITSHYAYDSFAQRHYRTFRPLVQQSNQVSYPYQGLKVNLPQPIKDSFGQLTITKITPHKTWFQLP